MRARQSQWAITKARLMLQTLEALTDETGAWSMERAARLGMADRCEGLTIPNASRLVDPLLEHHQLSGDPLSLKLAGLYSRRALPVVFEADGRFAHDLERSSGHVHSITSSLSGIVRYALFVGDARMADACRRIMDVGVPEYFSSWGWGDEVYPEHPADEIGRGEINQTGDVIRAALALGAAGEGRYYELAERYLRSMMLPTQHREAELRQFLHENPAPRGDFERDVLARTVGGYSMQLPNDRMQAGGWPLSTLDITSGAVHAMAECWRQRTERAVDGYRTNLLFDFQDGTLAIRSALPLSGRLEISARSPLALQVRVPDWVDRQTLRVEVGGHERPATMAGDYLDTGRLDANTTASLTFDVPCRSERETVDGTEYTTTWIGNQIIAILPRGSVSPLPFYSNSDKNSGCG